MKHHWTQIQRNRLNYPLDPRMLTSEGFVKNIFDRVVGMPQSEPKQYLAIHFDKSYVYEFFKAKIIDKLLFITKEDFLEFCSQVWDYARKEKNVSS